MPRSKSGQNQALLQAALDGLELQRQRIEEQIVQVRSLLGLSTGRRGSPSLKGLNGIPVKRSLSPAARKRIAAAQRKRWAEYRKRSGKSPE